jgi:hypothetical protein
MKNSKNKSQDNDNSVGDMLEAMIPLLGRITFPVADLQAIVMLKKRNPLDYIKAYNLCDGEHTLSEIAEYIQVSKGTLSPILAEWKDQGIVYEVTRKNGRFYKRLYRLETPRLPKMSKVQKNVNEEPVATSAEPVAHIQSPEEQEIITTNLDQNLGN